MNEQTANQSDGTSTRDIIDSGPMTSGIIVVAVICFVLNMFDGFDVVAMSAGAPALQDEWGISAVQKGYILTAALVGMAIGASFLAPFSDKIGRRPMILMSSISSGFALIATGLIENSFALMIIARIATGLGIGVIMATATALTAEYVPNRWRNFVVPIVVAGYAIGAIIVGPIANAILPEYGWRMLFLVGGVVTLAYAPVLYFFLPESLTFMESRRDKQELWLRRINASLRRIGRPALSTFPQPATAADIGDSTSIFARKYRANTFKLLAAFFVGYLVMYFLLTWIPSLYENAGYGRRQGIQALTLLNIGGVAGIFTMAVVTSKIPLRLPIAVFYAFAAIALISIFLNQPDSLRALNVSILFVGFMLQGAFTSMFAIASRVYDVANRSTGIGFSIGLGRTGAIFAPMLAGWLVAAGWGMYPLFALFAVPVLIAAVLIVTIRV